MGTVMNSDPSALYSGDFWTGFFQTPSPTPVIVTYSFPTSLPASDSAVPNFTAATNSSFVAFSTAEQAQAVAALGEWAAASGLVFVQVAPGKGDINFSNVNFSTLTTPSTDGGIGYNPFGAWNNNSRPYFTTDLTYAGDVFMNSQYQSATDGSVAYGTLLHEIGHAIGLKHPTQIDNDPATGIDENNVLAADDPSITIMSTQVDAQTAGNQHLLALDQSAAASIYGPAGTGQVITATSGTVTGSNSVSSWSWNATTQTLTQTAATASDVIHGTSVNDIINGGSGTDYLFGLDGTNTLNAGSGTDYLYGGPDTDTLNAGNGTDTLYAGTGTETMVGGTGTDVFYDGGGVDTITAQGTTDTFYVTSANTTITETNVDTTNQYAHQVFSSISYTLPQNVDTLTLGGVGLTGTANNDAHVNLFGDGTNASTLIASTGPGAGADYMVGGAGNDKLVAGTGADQLFGGGGTNTFVFQSDQDTKSYIGDFKEGTDKIDLSGIAMGLGQPLNFIGTAGFSGVAGQVNEVISGDAVTLQIDTNGTGSANFSVTVYDNGSNAAIALTVNDLIGVACYRAGTRIATDRGEVDVDTLAIGDRVITVSGCAKPVKWIGRRAYAGAFARGNRKILPVCFKAGSLGDGIPARDLWVSPEHAMFLDGLLIPAASLVNGHSVVQPEVAADVHYVHVELERHDVILAEGAWSESFIDDDSRMLFHNAREYFERYPDECAGPARFCAPRVDEGFELEAVRRRLDLRAGIQRAA